jgi:hypothetical protein
MADEKDTGAAKPTSVKKTAKSGGKKAKPKAAKAASKTATKKAKPKKAAKPAGKKGAAKKASKASAKESKAAKKGTAAKKRTPRAPSLDIGIAQLRESLEHSVTLSRERIQEVVDDAVKRGRMTHGDAEKMIGELLKKGRKQTDSLLSELEKLVRQARSRLP